MDYVISGTIVRDLSGAPVSAALIRERLSAEPQSILVQLPGLRFSSRTLVAAARISGRFPDALELEVGVTRGSVFYPSTAPADHVIADGFWYEIGQESLRSRDAALGLVSPGSPLGSPDLFRIRANHRSSWDLTVEVETTDAAGWAMNLGALPPPVGLTAKLFPYQEVGVTVLRRLAEQNLGCLLADQMGLGKTIQVIALLTSLKGPSLVVAPSSLLVNWVDEIDKFAPRLKVLVHSGPNRYGVPGPLRSPDVVITSYETAASDIAILEEIPWVAVIIDEAQQIRNPDTNKAKAVKRLSRRLAIAVTGTPVENKLRDLWSISEFVVPTLLGGREEFEREFPDEISAAHRLGSIVAPLTVRRRVSEVAKDLPKLVKMLTPLEMSERLRQKHEELRSAASNPLEVITRLRVLCAHADDALTDHDFLLTPKVQHTMSLLQEIFESGQKALVFAPFAASLNRLIRAAEIIRPRTLFLAVVDGRMPGADRKPMIDRFNAANMPGALFINPSAAGAGLNITGANHVVHFSPEYNPQKTEQATARAFRHMQKLTVFVHHLHYKASVEEDAARIAASKADLARAVEDGVGGLGGA